MEKRRQRAEKKRAFHVMAKPMGPMCNLDCRYCFYLQKQTLYPQPREWAMPDAVLETFIAQYIAALDTPLVSFAWQGGEPTLRGLDFFRQVVALQAKYAQGKRIENALQTNGVLLDDPWAAFLAENRFLVGLSIDGPAELHDSYRVDKGGAPSSDRVMRGLRFLKKHGVEFNALTAVSRQNASHPLRVYRFLRGIGCEFIQFIPVVEREFPLPETEPAAAGSLPASPPRVTDWSVDPTAYGEFLCTIYDAWVRTDVGRCFIQLFDAALESFLGLASHLCIYRPTCGTALVLEHNGDLYACDHFVDPAHRLGNITAQSLLELVESAAQRNFGEEKVRSLPPGCRSCEVRFACQGECPKNRFALTPDGEPGLNYLCSAYRRFFQHIAPTMQFMAEELQQHRPPANVMGWLRGQALHPFSNARD